MGAGPVTSQGEPSRFSTNLSANSSFRGPPGPLCWRPLNTFDRHLLREWLQILAIVVAATCGLMLVQVCYDDLRTLREAGARGVELWTYLFITVPSKLSIVLPIALLVSLLFVLTKLHRANELTAMRAAGVGLLRITAPVWLIGVLCCGLAWWLASTVVPWSVQKSESMLEDVLFRKQGGTLPPDRIGAVYAVAFENPPDGRIWMLNRYSRSTGRAYGVSVSELDAQRRERQRLVAAEAFPDPARGGWTFLRGRELHFNVDTGEELPDTPFAEQHENFSEDPQLMLLTERREVDLSFFQLRRVVDYYAAQKNPKGISFAVRYYGLIADTLGPLVAIAIAIPFAVTGVRVNAAVGVSKSLGLFCLYFLFTQIAGSLAIKQLVDPVTAAWLPNLGIAALAAWLILRLR
jgi:lipopolysaccharide export system permease protein